MAAKVVYTVREEKQGLQKQLGCMNAIFHLLDRGYLIGLHRSWRNQNRLTAGQRVNGEKELKKSSEKAKERNQKKTIIEKNRVSVESSRNSSSSSCSSTTFSSFDCSKRVQTEWKLTSEPTSPNPHKKPPEYSAPDIRDVVKESMKRVIRVTKDERAGLVMKHIDSPRPLMPPNPIQYDRKDQDLANVKSLSSGIKRVNEISRFSCDERESKYSLKSTFKVNELPRLSLDSKQNSRKNSMNESRNEPGRSNRTSSGIVARLMGLDSLTDPVCNVETLKVKPAFVDQLGSRSARLHSKIKPALQQQEVYDQAVKNDQPGSPMVKSLGSIKKCELLNRAVKPAKVATEHVKVTGIDCVSHKVRRQAKDPTRDRPVSSPGLQRSSHGIDQQCANEPSSNSRRVKKQSSLKTTHAKIKPVKTGSKQEATRMECSQHMLLFHFQNKCVERLIEDKPMVELAKLTTDQTSPVSVLDVFNVEDTPSPVKKKPNAFTDFDSFCIDETEWNQVGIYNLTARIDAVVFQQIELLNSKSSCKITNEDHEYIRKILLESGFLNDPDSAVRIAQIHPTSSVIRPGLFHILEKTNEEHHKNNPSSKSSKVKRKLIFDSVNDILFHKLVEPGSSGKTCVRFLDGEKLLNELWLEIDNLQRSSERCVYDEGDGIKVLVSADFDKSSQDWDKCCYEVPGIVLGIERLIFKDLINEVVNVDAGRRCRRLFSM
ncbi:uncharacterized protein LOC143623510 [Bidens hawaiensis]|uniref:uncharacterized protein LOC143623510 n=1 Tax=Bidens hawaiensis TaxID=980011 RepID=UPI00404B86E8